MGWFSKPTRDDTWDTRGAKIAKEAAERAKANRRMIQNNRRKQLELDQKATAAAKAVELSERKRALEERETRGWSRGW